MKDYEVCRLVKGEWVFDTKLISPGRKHLMQSLRGMSDYREGCVRVRVLK